MVNLAREIGSPGQGVGTRARVAPTPAASLGAWLARRLPIYWLAVVALLAVGDLLLSIRFAAHTVTEAHRAGVRFNLLALAMALALSVGIGLAWPGWWRRALALLAVAPLPVVLIGSGNVAAGGATLLIACVTSWLGRELAATVLGRGDLASGWAVGGTFGLGLVAAYGFVAGAFGLLRPQATWPVLGLVALALVAGARARLRREARALWRWLARPAERRPLHLLLAGAALACLWLNLLGAVTPEVHSDAIRQRLATAAYFARNGDLRADDRDLFVAREPALGEIAYAAILTVSPLQGAKLANFLVGILCAGAVFALGRQLGGPLAGGLGAFAFYATVIVGFLSQTSYLDLFTTAFALAGALLLMGRRQPGWRVATAAGACLGLGVAAKLHFGYVAVGLAATTLLLTLRHGGVRRACWLVAVLTGAAALAAAPWLLRSVALTGQVPGLAVAGGALAGGGSSIKSASFDLSGFGLGRSWWALLGLPFTTTLLSGQFGGLQMQGGLGGHLGYLPLALPALLVVGRRRVPTRALVMGALLMALLWFATAQYLRYGLPIIAFFCALGGAGFVGARRAIAAPRACAALHALLAVVALAGVFARMQLPDTARYHAFGLQTGDAFLDDQLALQGAGSYAIMRLLDADPTVTRVLALHDGARLYTRARISGVFTTGFDLAVEADDAEVLRRLRDGGYSHILLDRRSWAGSLWGWDRMTAVNEAFLRRHTALVAGDRYSSLYRILTPEEEAAGSAWAEGDELLADGDFAAAGGALPAGWAARGQPRYERAGAPGGGDRGTVRLAPGDTLTTTAVVRPGTAYLIATTSRGDGGYSFLRTRIEWRDAAGRTIGTGGEDTPVSPRAYQQFSTLVVAPPGAATAAISLEPTGAATWVGAASLRARNAR